MNPLAIYSYIITRLYMIIYTTVPCFCQTVILHKYENTVKERPKHYDIYNIECSKSELTRVNGFTNHAKEGII